MLTILAAVAQLERATIRERQAEGIATAKRNGVCERARKLAAEQIAEARARVSDGVPKVQAARDRGVGRQTLYAVLNCAGRCVAQTSVGLALEPAARGPALPRDPLA